MKSGLGARWPLTKILELLASMMYLLASEADSGGRAELRVRNCPLWKQTFKVFDSIPILLYRANTSKVKLSDDFTSNEKLVPKSDLVWRALSAMEDETTYPTQFFFDDFFRPNFKPISTIYFFDELVLHRHPKLPQPNLALPNLT